jgi:hypothetical protein
MKLLYAVVYAAGAVLVVAVITGTVYILTR